MSFLPYRAIRKPFYLHQCQKTGWNFAAFYPVLKHKKITESHSLLHPFKSYFETSYYFFYFIEEEEEEEEEEEGGFGKTDAISLR